MNWKILLSLSAIIISVISYNFISAANGDYISQNDSNPTENKPMNLEENLIDGNTKFAFKIFSQIFAEDKQKNIFISPNSISIALAMAYNGANGNTQQAMLNALELQGMSLEEINQANKSLQENLVNADPAIELAIANSLWMRQDFSFKPEFINNTKEFYQAKTEILDFNQAESLNIINKWVKDNTKNKIEKIINEIEPSDTMFLINAIYFKGDWQYQFDKAKTKEKTFYISEEEETNLPMMFNFGRYKYYENDEFQAVSLPYGQETRLSMYIFLPKTNNSLETFINQLTPENWNHWMAQFKYLEGRVQMPRFQLDYEVELKSALSQLGMGIIFNPKIADFSGMSEQPVYIDAVKHKTFLEVNEEGTEAAAITSIGIRATSVNTIEPFNLKIDRPFFCVIQDWQTETILFMGAIYNPE